MSASTNPPTRAIRRVLIANRGEIAIRIARSLRELGITPVAVHSALDPDAAHVVAIAESYDLGGSSAADSYLDVDKLVAAMGAMDCDALHPGYGFLSEDPRLPRALAAAGLCFIGPSAEAMEVLGSKQRAKHAAEAAQVPVVPGFNEDRGEDAALLAAAEGIGFPLLIKASAGGGGKGMRLVHAAADFAEELAACRREALAAFGSDTVLLEKYVKPARHVEIQVMADTHGKVVALNERECSVQRRHQKVIEEAPSPVVGPDLRGRMSAAAVRLAEEVGYQNAGTVEFLLDSQEQFYFLEMNTRLQVEHPVTELITGLDLVALQVEIAQGAALDELLAGRDLSPRGHAIELRIYAENPEQGYLPAAGTLHRVIEPQGPGIRVDSGVYEGAEISVHFDPMIAKLIVHAPDRRAAIARMQQALHETAYLGIPTNTDFLSRVLADADFGAGKMSIDFLEQRPELATGPDDGPDPEVFVAAALCRLLGGQQASGSTPDATARDHAALWQQTGALRLWPREAGG